MTQDVRALAHRRAALVADLIMAAAVGLLALILLAPTAHADAPPAPCSSTFGYGVPCGWAWSYAGCALAVLGTAAVLATLRRRRG